MPAYPGAVHNHFINYPQAIRVVINAQLASEMSLFEEDDTVVLQQTPTSGQLQGDLVVGEELPTKRIVYTDTGDDSSYNLKVAYEGWGEFLVEQAGDSYYTLYIKKGIAIQAGDQDEEKIFRDGIRLSTQIPTTRDLTGVEPPKTVSLNIEDVEIDYRDYDLDYTSEPSGTGTDGTDGGGSEDRQVVSRPVKLVYGPDGYVAGYVSIVRYSDGTTDREYIKCESSGLNLG